MGFHNENENADPSNSIIWFEWFRKNILQLFIKINISTVARMQAHSNIDDINAQNTNALEWIFSKTTFTPHGKTYSTDPPSVFEP